MWRLVPVDLATSLLQGFWSPPGTGFNDDDAGIAVHWLLMPAATPAQGQRDPAVAEDAIAQPPALAVNPRDTRWPRWPSAWPDGSPRPR